MSKRTRLTRLLDRGFYPAELPPTFRTKNFASAIGSLAAPSNYVGSTIFFDGATFRGPLRTFGVVNPVSYFLLSEFIAEWWPSIQQVYRLSACSGARPIFPPITTQGRAIGTATVATKRKRQQHLASAFPVILSLDINRFYGSIYTHSIPWAALGKNVAKAQYQARTLRRHWSDKLDILVRGCNQGQTIGLPIGPDTSRIVSEILLSRIDAELTAPGSRIRSTQIYHTIDDYQFGVMSQHEAEDAESTFVKVISRYGLRLNDFKTSVNHGLEFLPANFQRHFDNLKGHSHNFPEHFFDILYSLTENYRDVNVIGYALKRFARVLSSNPQQYLVKEYLQRLAYAAPHQVRFILPLLLGIYQRDGVDADTKRLISWGIEVCSRRNDVINLLWFLYSAMFLQIRVGRSLCSQCLAVGSELVDLMLAHGRHEGIFAVDVTKLRARYRNTDFNSPAWLPLYEIERRGWDASPAFSKIGSASDAGNYYALLRAQGVKFYRTGRNVFSVAAFEGWNLSEVDFDMRPWDAAEIQNIVWADGREFENYE